MLSASCVRVLNSRSSANNFMSCRQIIMYRTGHIFIHARVCIYIYIYTYIYYRKSALKSHDLKPPAYGICRSICICIYMSDDTLHCYCSSIITIAAIVFSQIKLL